MAFPSSQYGAEARWNPIQGILDVLQGVSGGGDRVQLIQYNNGSNYALDVRNLDTANGYGLRVQDGASANLLTVAKNAIGIGATTTDILTVSATARFADGLVGTPGIAFSGDTNTGLYRIGADNIGITLGGVKYVDLGTAAITITPQTDFTNGVKIANLHTLTNSSNNPLLTISGGQRHLRLTTSGRTGVASWAYNNKASTDQAGAGHLGFNLDTDNEGTWVSTGGFATQLHLVDSVISLYSFTSLTASFSGSLSTDATATTGPFLKITPDVYNTSKGTIQIGGGVQLGNPTGGNKGAGTLNSAGDIYKNNSAYTNPDYAIEHWATGKIERYADRLGAADYPGLLPLSVVETFAREHLHLPRVSREPAGIFERSDVMLEKIEELTLYLIDHEHRLASLETDRG